MKIQYVSDLHMEFPENFQYLQAHQLKVTGDILVVAGDSFYLKDRLMPKTKFWKWASDNYKQVLLVPGNHEYYGGNNMTGKGNSWNYKFLKNVGYYQNQVIRIGDTDIILSTLWSHIDNNKLYDVWNGMNDFRQIMYNDKPFTPKDFNTEYEKCLTFVKEAVKESTAKHIVVVTHHVPSAQCVAVFLLFILYSFSFNFRT